MEQSKNKAPMQVGKTTCACGDGCNCGCGYRTGYHVLRWVLGLFILFFVFALGVKLGEFITEFRYLVANENQNHGMYMRGDDGYINPGGPMIPANPPATITTTTTTP